MSTPVNNSAQPLLRTVGVQKKFGNITVADDISLSLAVGERRAVIGPNGAGKTSFVGLLSGTLRIDSGRIELEGRDITRLNPAQRVKRGLVRTFQITSIFRNLSVLENLFLARSERMGASTGLWRAASSRTKIIDECEEILSRLGLIEDRHRTVSEISYGKHRLIEVGLALCLDPRVLILDEPAAGLPGDEADRLLDIIAELPDDLAILMIEHDMEVVKRFASQITVLVRGRVLMTGTPQDVLSSEEVREVYLGHVSAPMEEGALDA
jgi:branched-chain amino acid transport system ATP-binding protein